MKRRVKEKIILVSTPREAMGWPCYYCGETLKNCKKKRCCNKCKGKNYNAH